VPILWRRLQIPNQTAVVRAELTLALEALGQQAAGPPAPPTGRGKGHGHGAHGAAAQQNGQPGSAQGDSQFGNGPGGSGPTD
jgi:hypothetical protein